MLCATKSEKAAARPTGSTSMDVDASNFGKTIMRKGASLHGIFVGNRAMFERMNVAIEVNGLRPVIDRVFDFDDAKAAYAYQASAALLGKVVIRV